MAGRERRHVHDQLARRRRAVAEIIVAAARIELLGAAHGSARCAARPRPPRSHCGPTARLALKVDVAEDFRLAHLGEVEAFVVKRLHHRAVLRVLTSLAARLCRIELKSEARGQRLRLCSFVRRAKCSFA